MKQSKMSNYELSNSIESVRLNVFNSSTYNKLISCGTGIVERQKAAQALIDYLCGKFKICSVKVVVTNEKQPHFKFNSGSGKKLGLYTHIGKCPISIKIWNTTPIKKSSVGIKTFAHTLLHEFIHHYDVQVLNLDTIHTAGFFKRIDDLEKKLAA